MNDLRIVGMVMLVTVLVCVTILIREDMRIRARAKRDEQRKLQERAETRDQRFHDSHEALYAAEKARRISVEQENATLRREIERMKGIMKTAKIGEVKESR